MVPGGADANATTAVTGNFTQAAGGSLAIQVNGLAAAEHGRMTVTGTTNLAGNLTIERLPAYTPTVGDTIEVMTYAAATGTFASCTCDLGGGLSFAPQLGATSLNLQAVNP